jgi:hypothetical protein
VDEQESFSRVLPSSIDRDDVTASTVAAPSTPYSATSHPQNDRMEERSEGLYGSFLKQWQWVAALATSRHQQQLDGNEGACASPASPAAGVHASAGLPQQPSSSPHQQQGSGAGMLLGSKMMGKASGGHQGDHASTNQCRSVATAAEPASSMTATTSRK